MPNLAYLSLGSNINPENNLFHATQLLAQFGKIRSISSVWETSPVGFLDQPNFLNAAVLLETECTAEAIKSIAIQMIEQTLHRIRTENPNAPRTIDVDLALFNDEVFILQHSQIPDPDIITHAFVAIPLAEIAPDYIHPLTGQTLSEIAAGFDQGRADMIKREDLQLWKLMEN